MLIILGKKSTNNKKIDNLIFLEKVCSLKNIKNKNNVLVVGDININDEGLVEEYNFYLDEVFITIKIDYVISLKKMNKLSEICSFYNVDLIDI